MSQRHPRSPILAYAIQEHAIRKDSEADQRLRRSARSLNILAIISYLPAQEHKGGTALIIPLASIERANKDETLDTAIARVSSSAHTSADGRLTYADLLLNGSTVRVASAWSSQVGPARAAFHASLQQHLNPQSVLAIDANCVPDETIDLQRPDSSSPYDNVGARELIDTTVHHDLTDIAREALGPKTPLFTKRTHVANGGTTHTRIDQIYTPSIDGLIFVYAKAPTPIRDTGPWGHRPLQVDISPITQERGKDLETVNETIYDDPAFLQRTADLLAHLENQRLLSGQSWTSMWEQFKVEARDLALKETRSARRTKDIKIAALQSRIDFLQSQISGGLADASHFSALDDAKKEAMKITAKNKSLADFLERDAYAQGRKHDINSAAFHRQWTPRNAAQWVEQIKVADWSDPSHPTNEAQPETHAPKIADGFAAYYKPLFEKKRIHSGSVNAARRTLQSGNRVLPPTAAKCDAAFTVTELLDVLNHLPTGKSPGPDRLPNRMYKNLSAVIAPVLVEVLTESRATHALPPTMLEGIISVLYKKNDRSDPRNYRPITLLNSDYKIFMRALTARMNEAVVQFVSRDQKGFVPDSFIAECTMRLNLIQAYIEDEDESALFIFLDMEKAFDRCSWDFLIPALRDLGFGQDFINCISLAYSHTAPPRRRMYVNGYLSDEFSLGSGVAQGCPLSPLLFLVIAEPLSRLVNSNKSIEGVRIGSTSHKLSQFADDSTFIARLSDVKKFNAMLKIWCRATAMRENEAKREVLPLGRLRRATHRIPPEAGHNVIPDGKAATSLGVPIGNAFDYTAWWRSKYRKIKQRVGNWRGTGRLTVTGRNILLQSILYGSMRYWLFSIELPDEILKLFESDAKNLLWAERPHLNTDELGTAVRSRRYIKEEASYKPWTQGGAGIMHIRSHIRAFKAQWIVKYLDPSDTPWKDILDHWIGDRFRLGRGILLAHSNVNFTTRVPDSAPYLKACIKEFLSLKIKQDVSFLSEASQGEPLWFNKRFSTHFNAAERNAWTRDIDTYRLSDLASVTGALFTRADWVNFIQLASDDKDQQWFSDRLSEVDKLLNAIPPNINRMLTAPTTQPAVGQYVLVKRHRNLTHAVITQNGADEIWLDANGFPHLTGATVDLSPPATSTPLTTWIKRKKLFDSPFENDDDDDDEDEKPPPRVAIGLPTTKAFPLDDGWYLDGQTPRKDQKSRPSSSGDDHRRMSDLTIKSITQHLTSIITEGEQPNCIGAWRSNLPDAINFKNVFASFGTPLSDPTEEDAWRKLVHRAWSSRNRYPGKDHRCRLGCPCADESQLHMIECPLAAPYWRAVSTFCTSVLKSPIPTTGKRALIFGLRDRKTLLQTEVRAFLRHAIRSYYSDMTAVHKNGVLFNYRQTLVRALHSFRNALLRYAHTMKRLFHQRRFTDLEGITPTQARERFNVLIAIQINGDCTLTGAFTQAVTAAETDLATFNAQQHPAPRVAARPQAAP
jgi:hypothetical protein